MPAVDYLAANAAAARAATMGNACSPPALAKNVAMMDAVEAVANARHFLAATALPTSSASASSTA